MFRGSLLDSETVLGLSLGKTEAETVVIEQPETVIKRNLPAADAPQRSRAFYDRARGIYFRSQTSRAGRPVSII